MPQPDRQTVHIDQALTDVAIAYLQSQDAFIATKVFPMVPVSKQSDKYYVFDKQAFLRDDMQARPPATESAGSGFTLSTGSYLCDVFALHKDLDNQTRANWDSPGLGDPEEAIVQYLTQQALQHLERQWATDFFATGKWGTSSTPTNLWSDYAASDPIADIETGKEAVVKNTGFLPNTLVLGYTTYKALKQHPDIIDRLKGAGTSAAPAIATQQALASIFEVERLFVARAAKATNVEGETAAYDFIHGKHAVLVYSAPAPTRATPSGGYVFSWTGVGDGMGSTIGIATIDCPKERAVRYEIEAAWDNVVTGSDLGYGFISCVS